MASAHHFNSRPSARGDKAAREALEGMNKFQFTPLREGRPHPRRRREAHPHFNSRPSARGDAKRCYMANMAWIFQFTPLREGRHAGRIYPRQTVHISIHAPPRGATFSAKRRTKQSKNFNSRPSARGDEVTLKSKWKCIQISIHAPPRGATPGILAQIAKYSFQFTPLREGRPYTNNVRLPRLLISIHAPPRGATRSFQQCPVAPEYFNSRPSARGDPACPSPCGIPAFQFTPLREGRPLQAAICPAASYFNSRPSARGDKNTSKFFCVLSYFNSRPSARGDQRTDKCAGIKRISIHAPPRGATLLSGLMDGNQDIFQFTPLREGRRAGSPERIERTAYFNSRPSARGDGKRYAISANLLFNPYKSAWLNNSATQFVEIILVIFHRIIA